MTKRPWTGSLFKGILHISDLHIAERSQDQDDMADAMIAFLLDCMDNRIPKDVVLRALFVDGDFFDHAIRLYQTSFRAFIRVFSFMVHECTKRNMVLRFLNGTFEHDHGQLKYFMDLKNAMAPDCQMRVIDGIELEYIETLDLRFLYIPDDMPYGSSQEIIDVVEEKLRGLGWTYVDYACTHGFFDFTVPPVARAAQKIIYSESQFPFVRKLINSGHVHIHQRVGKVISNGNVDNCRFGEVGPKGAVLVVDLGESARSLYLENQYAAPYITRTYPTGTTTEEITRDLDQTIAELHTTRVIHIRALVEDKDLRSAVKTYLLDTYPHIRSKVAAPTSSGSGDEDEVEKVIPTLSLPSMPTPQTLSAYVHNRILPKDPTILEEDVQWALTPKTQG